MSGLTTETYGKTESVTSPEFPSEDPTEIELTKWLEAWTNYLRSKHLLSSAAPAVRVACRTRVSEVGS